MKYAGELHLCGMILEDIYGFITNKNIFDKLYIFSFVAIPFSWVICKDECLISYVIKKIENKKYVLGNEPENVNDISKLFKTKQHYLTFFHINNAARICSVIIVNKRTTNINTILIPTCILYLCYNYDITYQFNYRKVVYPYFQIMLCLYFCATCYSIY